jgi:hypothetical protein
MPGTMVRRFVLLILLGGCGQASPPPSAPFGTLQNPGGAITAAPWSPVGPSGWRAEQPNPVAPPGWQPGWGRPIDPGIGDGTIPEAWRHRPWPRPTPSIEPPEPPDRDHWPPRRWPPDRWSGWPGWPGRPPWAGPGPQPLPPQPEINPSIVDEFRLLDVDGSGWLSAREYVEGKMAQIRYFQAPSEDELARMRQRLYDEFVQGDVNRDGRMSVYEYAHNPIYHILGS